MIQDWPPRWAERYPADPDFKEFALNELLGLSYDDALQFYAEFLASDPADADVALLGLCDRYFLLTGLLNRVDMTEAGGKTEKAARWLYDRCREVELEPDGFLDLWSREHYKLQALDEPQPTPDGWKLHGDLKPGDRLFGPDGKPCTVIALNRIVEDAECYEIEFDDGTTIQAGAEHLWPVERRTKRRVPGTWKVGAPKRVYRETVLMQTREIAAHRHAPDNRLALRVNEPLDLPTADLPIAPYVLGAWLGDGTSESGAITGEDAEVFSEIARRGYSLGGDMTPGRNSDYRTVYGLRVRLRSLGVLNNKHVPQAYLRGSIAQRLDLLRGLMDTDGHCNTRGTATFCNTNERLADGVYELAASLGMRPMKRRHVGQHDGAPYPFWQVSFQAYADRCPFLIPRKAARCKPGKRKARHFIVACRRVPTVPMRCIQVDRPDGLYLTGRAMLPTHNSTIITFGGVVQEILRDPEVTIGIFSNTRPNAKKSLRQVKEEFQTNHRLKVLYADVLWANPKTDAPKWSEDGGIVVRRRGNPKEATVEAWGLVDGLPVGPHFKLRVYDDTVTKESVSTPEQVKKTTEAYEHSTNLGSDDGRQWNIGTRYGLGDTYKTLLDRKTLKPRVYAATDNGLPDGNPVFWTPEIWAKKKAEQPTTYPAQLLQNPAAGPQKVFDLKTFKTWQVRPRTLRIYIIVDPAKGPAHKEVGRDRDRTAIAVIAVDAAKKFYLVDGYRHRMSLGERWEAVKTLRRKWLDTRGVVDVEVGYEQYGMLSDNEYFERMMQIEGKQHTFAFTELSSPRDGSGAKEDRIARLVPDIIAGRFLLPFLVWHEGMTAEVELPDGTKFEAKGIARWVAEKGEAEFAPHVGDTPQMRRAIEGGMPDTVCQPIKRLDENKAVYDVTRDFLEEAMFFPFGTHDDLLDACSRIYDMEPLPPKIIDPALLDTTVYVDGV